MALSDAFGDAGREVWAEWSASSAKYDAADQEKNWHSFAPGGGITIRTLFHLAQQHGWQNNHHAEKKQQTADNKTAPEAVEGISVENFYAYMPTHNYIYVPSRESWPAASVNARLAPMPVLDSNGKQKLDNKGKPETTPASKWLDQNRPVSQMTWAPGEPLIITNRLISHGGWIKRLGEAVFNLYLPPTIIPGNAAQAEPWLDHIYKVYPDDAEHIIRYFAHRVQRPAEKLNHSLVLGGDQGIGKDTALEPVKYAVGPWNFLEVTPVQILGRFNGFLKSTILRISEARDLGEYDRFALYDHMKSMIAVPPDVLRVDEKNLREHSILNCCSVIITTNHRTDGIYLPADDRRHYVAWSSLKKTNFDESYWDRLWRWYLRQGLRHVAAYLLEFDISAFNPKHRHRRHRHFGISSPPAAHRRMPSSPTYSIGSAIPTLLPCPVSKPMPKAALPIFCSNAKIGASSDTALKPAAISRFAMTPPKTGCGKLPALAKWSTPKTALRSPSRCERRGNSKRSNDLASVSHERRDDFVPFRRQFMRRWFASRLSIPIVGIIQVAFDAVEVGVHPSAILIVSIHNDAMRFVPILVCRPPHCLQRHGSACRRRFRRERLPESGRGHAEKTPATTTFPARTIRRRAQ